MCNDHDHHVIYSGSYKEGKKTTYKRLCFQHAVKATLQGIDIDVEVSEDNREKGCDICGYL